MSDHEWNAGDGPERLWRLIIEAQDRGMPLIVQSNGIARLTKNASLTDTGALVMERDLAFWPTKITLGEKVTE